MYSKCKTEGVNGRGQFCEYEKDNNPHIDSQLNPCECPMLNDCSLYNVYVEVAEPEQWSILNTRKCQKGICNYKEKSTMSGDKVQI